MKTIKMSYKGLVFSANPSSIKVQLSKSISKKSIPFSTSNAQEVCFKPSKISGEGMFTGADAREFAHKLMHVFKSEGSAYLLLPNAEPITVFFESLDISYDSSKNCVSYSFSFVEDCKSKKYSFDFGYTYALEGENLYDISNRTDVSVEKLFEYNTYKNLFSVSAGDKVRLC